MGLILSRLFENVIDQLTSEKDAMPLSAMLFSFTERLNRARFWLASIALIVVGLVLRPIHFLPSILNATSPFSFAAPIAVEGRAAMSMAFAGLRFVSFVYLLVSFADLLGLFAGFAVAIKRLHDRDKSAFGCSCFMSRRRSC